MGKFEETVRPETPRLVVKFQRGPDGGERFEWGTVGQIPIVTLVGCVARVQSALHCSQLSSGALDLCSDRLCPEQAVVIVWDGAARRLDWFAHFDTPVDAMCGMLEIVKTTLVGSLAVRQMAQQQMRVLGPDGTPARR